MFGVLCRIVFPFLFLHVIFLLSGEVLRDSLTHELMSRCCDEILSPKLGTGSLKYNLLMSRLPITICGCTLIKSDRSAQRWGEAGDDGLKFTLDNGNQSKWSD